MARPNSITESPLETDDIKRTEEFGLKVIKSCYEKWRAGYGGESWKQRIDRYNKNRSYALGKQDTTQFKDIVKVNGQIPVVNLDYRPLPIAISLINRMKDRYMQRQEKIRCAAVDPLSQEKKKKAKDSERFKMKYGNDIQALQENSGLQLEHFSHDDPQTEHQLDIKFGFNYREREEIIMELGLDLVFYENDFSDVIKDRIIDDIINCGFGVVETCLNGEKRIKTPWVKPENFITSYSEFNDFRDWQWQGKVDTMSITEVRLKYPGKIPEEKLFKMAQANVGKLGNGTDWNYTWTPEYENALAKPWDNFNIQIVDLYYKALDNLTYEKVINKYGNERLVKTAKQNPSKQYEKSSPFYTAYHGVWVVDTDVLLEWGKAKNQIKSNANLTEVLSPYAIYMHNNTKCNNTPLIETMIPSIDMMQMLQLKSQNIIAMTAPDGYDIDIGGLSDIDMGLGIGVVSPMQLFDIYLQTGNQYYLRKDLAGDGEQNQPPIVPKNHSYSNKLEQLDAKWQREYQKLLTIIGDNNLSAGQITNQAVGNKTLNDARELSESASNYVYNTYLNILKRTAKNVQILLWDRFVYGEGALEGYVSAVGNENVDYLRLEATDDFSQTLFDTKIEAIIDDGEAQRLNQRIDIALGNKEITIQDAIELDLIENTRYKAFLLAERAKQKQVVDMQIATKNSQENTAAATAATQAKAQGDMQLEQMQHQNKMQQIDKELQGKALDEDYKFSGILKAKVVDAILSKPDAKISDIPDFIWAGLNVTNDAQKQLMIGALQQYHTANQALAAQAQQQQQQQAIAQQQQQQGQDPQQAQQQGQPQQEQAA